MIWDIFRRYKISLQVNMLFLRIIFFTNVLLFFVFSPLILPILPPTSRRPPIFMLFIAYFTFETIMAYHTVVVFIFLFFFARHPHSHSKQHHNNNNNNNNTTTGFNLNLLLIGLRRPETTIFTVGKKCLEINWIFFNMANPTWRINIISYNLPLNF